MGGRPHDERQYDAPGVGATVDLDVGDVAERVDVLQAALQVGDPVRSADVDDDCFARRTPHGGRRFDLDACHGLTSKWAHDRCVVLRPRGAGGDDNGSREHAGGHLSAKSRGIVRGVHRKR